VTRRRTALWLAFAGALAWACGAAAGCRSTRAFSTSAFEVRCDPAVVGDGTVMLPRLEIAAAPSARGGGRFELLIFEDRNGDGRRDPSEPALLEQRLSLDAPPLRIEWRRLVLPCPGGKSRCALSAQLLWKPDADPIDERLVWSIVSGE